jgi:hypothetical protein
MEQKQPTTWERNAPTQIVLDSIFAALAGVLIVTSLQDPNPRSWRKLIELIFAFSSFLFLARSAEGTTTALDERDVDKYVYYLTWYNLGVVLLIWSLAILIYGYFYSHFLAFCIRHTSCSWVAPETLNLLIPFSYAFFFLVVAKDWLEDVCWIIFKRQETYNEYIQELKEESEPTRDWPSFLRLIDKLRRRQ